MKYKYLYIAHVVY